MVATWIVTLDPVCFFTKSSSANRLPTGAIPVSEVPTSTGLFFSSPVSYTAGPPFLLFSLHRRPCVLPLSLTGVVGPSSTCGYSSFLRRHLLSSRWPSNKKKVWGWGVVRRKKKQQWEGRRERERKKEMKEKKKERGEERR